MKEIIYKTIGIRGRTTIPFIFRTDLKIGDDTVLEFRKDNGSVIITPMRKCKKGTCELKDEMQLTENEVEEFISACDEEDITKLLSAIQKKLLTKVKGSN